jgi:Lar family restriction alleviation protein
MREIKLLKCPFCGCKDISFLSSDDVIGYFYAYCHSCHASTGNYKTKKKVIEAWNRRAGDVSEKNRH